MTMGHVMLYTPADERVGPLTAISASITQEINGEYTCSVIALRQNVLHGSIIELKDANGKRQKFRVSCPEETLDHIRLEGEHITCDLREDMIVDRGWEDRPGSYVWPQLLQAGISETRFTGASNIETINSMKIVRKNILAAILGSADNSFLNRFGGEMQRDNYQVNMLQRLGSDRGYRVQYRVNLTGLEVYEDASEIVNRVIPTCLNDVDGVVRLPEIYIDSTRIAQTPIPHVRHIHFGDIRVGVEDDDGIVQYPTLASAYTEMRNRVQALYTSGADMPQVGAVVRFVDLSKTDQYADYADLLDLELGDTVRADYDGRTVTQRMVAYSWDAIRQEYSNITLGFVQPSEAALLARYSTVVQQETHESVRNGMIRPLVKNINELNESVVNAVGMFATRFVNPDGSVRIYYHDQPVLENSQIIEYYPEPGSRVWTDQGWQGGSPAWQYGYSNRGLLVMRLIATVGLNAEWVWVSENENLATHLTGLGMQISSLTDATAQYEWWPDPPYISGQIWYQPPMTTAEILALQASIAGYLAIGLDMADYVGGNLYVCQVTRETGVFTRSDWQRVTSSKALLRTSELTADGVRLQEQIVRTDGSLQRTQAQIALIDGTLQTQVTRLDQATSEQLSMRQTADSMEVRVTSVEGVTGQQQATVDDINTYMRFDSDGLSIGDEDSATKVNIKNDQVAVMDGGVESAVFSGQQTRTKHLDTPSARIGNHRIEALGDGITVFAWMGGD